MKPQQRVVTAHDIESSLYYFHVDSTNDDEIRETLFAEQEAQRQDGVSGDDRKPTRSRGQSPKRKPLPATPQLALQDRPEHPPKVYPHFQVPNYHPRGSPEIGRKPLPSISQQRASVSDIALGLPPRKLMGPRPLHSRQSSTATIAATEDVPGKLTSTDISLTNHEEPAPKFTITIIRRDPSSGGQWNVGKLIAGPAFTRRKGSGSFPNMQSLQEENCISIYITTPGYNRFCYRDIGPTLELSQLNKLPRPSNDNGEQVHPETHDCPGFSRQIHLERIRSQSTHMSPRKDEYRSSVDSGQSKDRSTGSPDSPSHNYNLSSSPSSSSFLRPYTFQSPWNGTCKFTTGMAGKSLKCKHTIAAPATSPGNWSPSTYTVSELRFNLHSSKLFSPFSPRRPRFPASDSRRSSFLSSAQLHSRSHSVDDSGSEMRNEHDTEDSDDEQDDRMDLSLGQEQAGGGIRGKQAKLGKLIVEDEGLKMLDLVVAANMGVWWYTWGMGN